LPLLSPVFFDVHTFAIRCLHVCHDVKDPSGGKEAEIIRQIKTGIGNCQQQI
jgi:hypothetical protein